MFCWGARRRCVDQGGFPATGGRGAGRRAQTSSCCSPGGVSDAEVVNSERFQFTPTRVFLLFWCRLRETRRLVPTPCFSEGLSFSSQRTREWISLLGLPEWKLCCPSNLEFTPKWTNTNSQRLANRQEQKGRENRGDSSGPYHTGTRNVTDQGPRSCGSWDGTRDMGLGRLSGLPRAQPALT